MFIYKLSWVSGTSFIKALIGCCEGYTWVHALAESVCARGLWLYCYNTYDHLSTLCLLDIFFLIYANSFWNCTHMCVFIHNSITYKVLGDRNILYSIHIFLSQLSPLNSSLFGSHFSFCQYSWSVKWQSQIFDIGSHNLLSIIVQVFLVWQTYLFFLTYTKYIWKCIHVYLYPMSMPFTFIQLTC